MSGLISWLAASKVGRWLSAALAILGGVAIIAARFYSKGKEAVRAKQQRKTLEDIEKRRKLDADIDRLDDDDIRQRMQNNWSR